MSETNNIFEQIKNASDIVSEVSVFVDLTKKGRNYWGICPFHDDTSPSMSVSPEKQFFKCFVCQVGGNVINFISNYEKISFVEAAKRLADKAGITFNSKKSVEKKYTEKQQKTIAALKEAMNFFQYSLSTTEGNEAMEYLKNRGITQKEIDAFSIGFAPNKGLISFLETKGYDRSLLINASLATENMSDFFRNRIIFGIKNEDGQVVGYSARTMNSNEKAKYINSAETKLFNKKEILYNFSNAEDFIRRNKEVIITEGFMDVIALAKADIFNVVAIMGTALTSEHVKFLKNKNIVLMLDSDSAGISATIKSIQRLIEYNNSIFVVENNSGLDPDELLKKHGKIELQKLTQKRIHALEFIFNKHLDKFGKDSPEKVEKFVKSFSKYLNNTSSTYKDFYINKLSETLKINTSTIKEHIKPAKINNTKDALNKLKPVIIDNGVQKISSNKTIDENKWAMKLLSAMMNKRSLIPIFERSHVNFIDPMLQVMGGYIVKLNKGIKPTDNEKDRNMLIGIKNYSQNQLSEREFEDLIHRVNKTFKQQTLNKLQSKLQDKTVDSTKMLEQMAKIIKEREE